MSTSGAELLRQVKSKIAEVDPSEVNELIDEGVTIVDVRGSEPVTTKGAIPPRAVVIPGTLPKRFAAGEFGTPCALIIGERSESTDQKTSLNAALREHDVAV